MFFDYEKKPKENIEEYEVVRGQEIFIPPHQWSEMLDKFTRDEIITYLSSKMEGLPFPYTKYTPQEVHRDWLDVQSDYMPSVIGEWGLPRCEINDPHTYRGRYVYFAPNNKGLKVSNQYTEFARVLVDHREYKCAMTQWTRKGMKGNKRYFLRPFFTLYDRSKGVNSKMFRNAINMAYYIPSQFKPTLAKAMYNFFGAKRVLDFSMGWGDRLVGFLASDAESYVGIDPNTKLHEPYRQIDAYCNTSKETRFICSPAEDADLSDVKVDFVFTSPPYFDTEKYSQEETQSWKRYPETEDWLNGFLYPTLKKCWEVLEEGGRIAVNISDKVYGDIRVCQSMIEYMESIGANYEGVIGYRMSKRPGNHHSLNDELSKIDVFCEPIFIWSKGSNPPEPKWHQDNYFGV
jgi:hypothetical protein